MADAANPYPFVLDPLRVRDELDAHTDRGAGETFDLRRERIDSNITGYVVRTEFRGVVAATRQRWLSDFFKDRFGPEARQIGLVLAFTPEEFEDYLEDRAA